MIGANHKPFLYLKGALSVIIPCIFLRIRFFREEQKGERRLIINELRETFLVKRVSMETLTD